MAVLSVDLATRRWSDLGIVVLDRARGSLINCEIIPWNDAGPVEAEVLAGRLNHLCGVRGIRVLMLDGPQAWKSRSNGLEHSRVSERQLNTAAKTGLPGMVKPLTYRPFAEFCVDVYDALCRRGWSRLATQGHPGSIREQNQERVLVEGYPFAAWKSLGLKPLPAKRRAKISDLAESDSVHHKPSAESRSVAGDRRRPARPGSGGAQHGWREDRRHPPPPRRGPLARGLHRASRAAKEFRWVALAALTTCGGGSRCMDNFSARFRRPKHIMVRPCLL